MTLDEKIFYFFYNFSHKNIFTDGLIVAIAEYLPFIVILIALIAISKHPRAILPPIVSIAIVYAFRYFYHHSRPFISLDLIPLFKIDSFSFPSMHASLLFALSSSIYFYDKKLGRALLILSAIVGLARITAGVHYPSDVLGGAALGILVAYCILVLWRPKNTHRKFFF